MANPAIVVCTAATWVKVADDVQTGMISVTKTSLNYLQTYRVAGDPAPTDNTDAVKIEGKKLPINSSEGIDIYIKAQGAVDGEVRVEV